jgi:hypothetical protein
MMGVRDGSGRGSLVRQIKGWVLATLGDDDETTVMVAELACSEPGCPPLETVIALLAPRGRTDFKIHKGLCDVTEADVLDGLARVDTCGKHGKGGHE